MCYIYTLHASNDPECRPRYVGFTTRLKRREIEHNTGREQGRKGVWAQRVLASGGHLVLKVVHAFVCDDAIGRSIIEADWIEKYRDEFPDLLNDSGGGDGVAVCSPELSAKKKLMHLGRKHTLETREKVRLSKLGKKRPPEVLEALRRANLGRKLSPEHRAKISERSKKYRHSPEARAKISKANKGRKPSQKCIEAIRKACLGKKHTPERNAKISLAGIGRKNSPESIAKAASKIRGQKRSPEQIEKMKLAARKRSTDPGYKLACSVAQKLRFAKARGKSDV